MADSKLSALSLESKPAYSDAIYGIDSVPNSYQIPCDRFFGQLNQACEGRLTLTSGTPITSSDVTSATTIYFTPFLGQNIAIYDGTRWKMYAFTERSLALGTLVSPTNSDVFIYDSSGTLTLIFGPKWSTATSRGTGAGTTELVLQDGVWVNKVAISGGPAATAGRYLGTISWTSTTTTEDSLLHRLVWNCYNRQPRKMKKTSSTSSWTYNSTSFRNAANDVANQLDFVVGLAEVQADVVVYVMSTDNAGGSIVPGIGIDSTTNIAEILQRGVSGQTITCPHLARLIHYPSIGQHQYNWLEALSAGTTATTSFGGDGASFISGIYGTIWG